MTWETAPAGWETASKQPTKKTNSGWETAPTGWESAPEQPNKKKAGWLTALHAANEQAANAIDTGISMPAGALANWFGADGDKIFREMDERTKARTKAANPDNEEIGLGGKIAGALATLPVQLAAMPFSPAETGKTMVDEGESLPRAIAGTALDTAGNMLGVALPGAKGATTGARVATGAGLNMAQDAGVRQGLSMLAENQRTKDILGPSWDSTAVAGILGSGVGLLHHSRADPRLNQPLPAPEAVAPVRPEPVVAKTADGWENGSNIRQTDLPFNDGVETIAREQNARGEQMDMFVEAEKRLDPYQEVVLKNQADAKKAAEVDAAWDVRDTEQLMQLREEQRLQAEAEKTWDQADILQATEDRLRADAYAPPDRADVRQSRGRVPRSQRGAIDVSFLDTIAKQGADALSRLHQNLWDRYADGGYKDEAMRQDLDQIISKKVEVEVRERRKEGLLKQDVQEVFPGYRNIPSGTRIMATHGTKYAEPTMGVVVGVKDIRLDDGPYQLPVVDFGDGRPRTVSKSDIKEVFSGPKGPRGQRGGLDIVAIADGFQAILDGKIVGYLKSNLTPEQGRQLSETANVDIVKVNPAVKGTGVGSALYDAWNSAHQGNVAPSGKTSPDAWNLWKRNYPEKVDEFVAQEAARLRNGAPKDVVLGNITDPAIAQRVLTESNRAGPSIPKNQRGGVDVNAVIDGVRNIFSNNVVKRSVSDVIDNNTIPRDPLPEDTIKGAMEQSDSNTWRISGAMASGSTLEAMTRNSRLVTDVSRTVQNAVKRAELYTKEFVFPTEQAFNRLPIKDVELLGRVMREEMMAKATYTVEQLEQIGLSEKQLAAYAGMREMLSTTMAVQNEARLRQGLEPISEKEYYLSSRWKGDFRQPVHDADGKLVWYLAANSKWGLGRQIKALKKSNPTLIADPKKAHTVRSSNVDNIQSLYTTMLDVLGRDDPAVQKIKEAFENSVSVETSKVAGQEKHFESKANIRGFVGDRPGYKSRNESLEMFNEQIQYAKNAYKWAALQDAGNTLKKVFSNEELSAKQPINMEYAKDYYMNAMGHGTARWVGAFEDAFRSFGVSPSVVSQFTGGMKNFFITQKLGYSLGYSIAGILQVVNTVPWMMDALVKGGANPLKGLSTGLVAGLAMGGGHYAKSFGSDVSKMLGTSSVPTIRFLNDAFTYAEDNGITSRSVYDEAPINSRGIASKVGSTLSTPIKVVETFSRSMAFMTFVQSLKDSKKFKTNEEIFQRAEELTNASMVDYRSSERPMAFSKLGVAGDAMNTLQTFPINLLNQYRYFGKEAMKGNYLPLMSLLAVQATMAGAMGMPGFNDFDKIVGWAKSMLPDSAWEKVKDFDPKLFVLENLGEAGLYGALSNESGVSMTSRLAAPGLGDMAVSPLAPAADIAKQVGNVANFAMDPMDTQKQAQALHSITPTGLQGIVETKIFPDEFSILRADGTRVAKKATDLAGRKAIYDRTPEEQRIRAVGLRSQNEAMTNDVVYATDKMEREAANRTKTIPDKFYNALRGGNIEKARELAQIYSRINGTPISDEAMQRQVIEEHMTAIERKTFAAQKVEAIKNLARIQKLFKELDESRAAE